jgi:hypothetical protein
MYFTDLSNNCKENLVGTNSPTLILSNIDFGIRLTFAPMSHKTQLNMMLSMAQDIVKLPGSYNFGGSLFITIALNFSVKVTISSSSFLLLDKMFFSEILYRLAFE